MGIPDPIKNCILEICCGAERAQEQFAKQMVREGVCDEDTARKCADWVYEYFDLAPKDSLHALKSEIARLARDTRKAE